MLPQKKINYMTTERKWVSRLGAKGRDGGGGPAHASNGEKKSALGLQEKEQTMRKGLFRMRTRCTIKGRSIREEDGFQEKESGTPATAQQGINSGCWGAKIRFQYCRLAVGSERESSAGRRAHRVRKREGGAYMTTETAEKWLYKTKEI